MFRWIIDFEETSPALITFINIRLECWNIWGPGLEFDSYKRIPVELQDQYAWCFASLNSSSMFFRRIYLKTDEQASYAQLKWF